MRKLLYIGTMAQDSTSYARFCALNKHYKIEKAEFPDINIGFNRIKERLNLNKHKNQNLVIEKVKSHKFDIIWFDKPVFVTLKFIKELKKYAFDATLVAHVTDDLTVSSHHFNDFLAAAKQFNFIFTCNRENINEFPDLPLFYNELGFDSRFFVGSKINVKHNNEIIFVGHYEPSYLEQLKEIALQAGKHGFNVKVFGPGWWRANFKLNKGKNLIIKNGWISRDQMILFYRQSKLAVALYSSVNRNKTSTRIFELAALGTPFLVKPNDIINDTTLNYIPFDQIHDDQFWTKLLNNYSTVQQEFISQTGKCEKYSWSSRILECVKIING